MGFGKTIMKIAEIIVEVVTAAAGVDNVRKTVKKSIKSKKRGK